MPVADEARTRKRVLELLLASPRGARYSGTVGGKAVYASQQEVTDTILEIDFRLRLAVVETEGQPLAAGFMQASGSLSNGTLIPAHVGVVGDVYVDTVLSKLAPARSDVLEIRANAALYPLTTPWHFIEQAVLYHTGTNGVVWRPVLTRTSACQIDESLEDALVAGAVGLLMKDGGDPSFFQYYANIYAAQEAAIRGREFVIPATTQYEKAAA